MNDMHAARRPGPIDVHIGRKLRQYRHSAEMSQPRLAELCGIKPQQIQDYETGENRIPASRLYVACKALKIDISLIFKGLP